MKRITFGSLLAALALAVTAFAGAQTTDQSSAQTGAQNGLANITGDWAVQLTGNKFMAGTLHLTQVNDTIIGSAMAGSGNGVVQFHGTMSAGKVSGNWRGPTGETGWLTLNFAPDGMAFSGDYGYGGRNPTGQIVAKKVKTTDF